MKGKLQLIIGVLQFSVVVSSRDFVSPCGLFSSTPASIPPTPSEFRGECPRTGYTYPSGSCQSWDIAAIVVLREDAPAVEFFNIRMFLQALVKPCDSESTLRFLVPGLLDNTTYSNECQNVTNTMTNLDSWLDSTTPQETWISSTQLAHPILKMFEILITCEQDRDVNRGGVLYFFTDLKCSSSCVEMTYMYDLIEHQEDLVDRLRSIGYILKVIYMDSRNDTTLDCDIKTALYYCTKYEQVIISGTTLNDLKTYSDRLRPCSNQVEKKHGITEQDLLILILVPLSCALLAVSVLLLVLLYRGKTRISVLKRFRRDEGGRLKGFHSNLATVSERYNTLKQLAETQRKSSIELDPADLYIEYVSIGLKDTSKYSRGILKGTIERKLQIKPNAAGHYEVAVKRLTPTSSDAAKSALYKEICVMKNIGPHPHILYLIGSVSSAVDPMLITEFCVHGDLLSLLRRTTNNISVLNSEEEEVLNPCDLLSIAWQISVGMEHIHASRILHRDICARNIFVTTGMIAKIGHFGSAGSVSEPVNKHSHWRWHALESLRNNTFSDKTDVWSFGVLLYEMFTYGSLPYQSIIDRNILIDHLTNGGRLKLYHNTCDREIGALLRICHYENEAHRPSFSEITKILARCLRASDEDFGYIQISRRRSTLQSAISSNQSMKVLP